ncbi:hypothetical protein AMECASPLE_033178 [Ameca splendens]|uniref:Uncharacterized protein n=1 Tax=Ameca splendens TaxID=208324 RepID=A0ABV0YHT8_9TELE
MAEFHTNKTKLHKMKKMFRLFHSKLLLSLCPNLTSQVNHAEEKLSRVTKFEETSTVNKGLASANLRSCWWGGSFCRPGKLHVTAVTMVMRSPLSFLQTGKTAPLGVVETGSLLGTLWNTVCFCRPQRESQAMLVP